MFDVGAPELLVLVIIAVILFGPEKLPEFARKAARVIRYVRSMAGNAQQQLSNELGSDFTDLDVRDLNPKTFIQKHLLEDVDPIVADVKKEITESTAAGHTAASDLTSAMDDAKGTVTFNGSSAHGSSAHGSSAHGSSAHGSSAQASSVNGAAVPRVLTPFDPDAT